MPLLFNKKAKITESTGLSSNANLIGGRFFNKDGSANILVKGIPFWQRANIYHFLLNINWLQFFALVFGFYFLVNIVFTFIYLLCGVNQFTGIDNGNLFWELFFFSTQTFTTVGYGRINPVGHWANAISAVQSLSGLLSFAIVTGLLYGRFSKPRPFIHYSKNVLIVPHLGGTALMLRMVPFTKNHLVNVEAKISMAMQLQEDGVLKQKFFSLPLQIDKVNTMTANWTLVHIINEESPLYNLTHKEVLKAKIELLVFVQGFDESFANTVISRTSYTANEFVFGATFLPMFQPNEQHTQTVLHVDKLNHYSITPLVNNK